MSSATTPKPWSLALRLTAGFAAAAFALVLLATVALDWALRSQFNHEQDEILADKATVVAALIRQDAAGSRLLQQELDWEWTATRRSRVALRVTDSVGHLIVESPGMSDRLPLDALASIPEDGAVVVGRDGISYRVSRTNIETAGGGLRQFDLALDRSEDDELLREFRLVVAGVLAAAPLACALMGYRVARRGLRPLSDVSATAARITAANLSERIDNTRLPKELAELAVTFNAMLARLEESFVRITRFSADIAHELRTPLQVLRGESEVALAQARSTDEYKQVLESGLEECARLAKLIDTLLFLARADNPEMQIAREPLKLASELAAAAEFYGPMADDGGVTLTTEAAPDAVARLDRTLLQRALGNLIANALAHTPAGGRVVLRAVRRNDQVEIDVDDTGCGVAPEHLPHLFDRFYRADPARAPAAGHLGLGLALVQSIAVLHGGTAAITSQPERGTRVRLTLPG
jgi:two-component system, OmpR family, heavy metal sensor histidine kinase CusS